MKIFKTYMAYTRKLKKQYSPKEKFCPK